MGRTSYALMSLVAAVPAAILAAILVLGFLQHADGMPGMLVVVAGFTLLIAVALTVAPVGILLFGGPKSERKEKAKKGPRVAAAAGGAALKEADESFVADEGDAEATETVGDDDWNEGDSEIDISESEFMDSEADEFELDDNASNDFDFDDDHR